jgi:hypothetical protein
MKGTCEPHGCGLPLKDAIALDCEHEAAEVHKDV